MQPHQITEIIISEDAIKKRVEELVIEIESEFGGHPFALIGILRGSFMFLADLMRAMNRHNIHPRMDFITLESYGTGTRSTGFVRVTKDIGMNLEGTHILLVDDILDTGRTLNFAAKHLLNRDALVVKTCTLLDKPARRLVQIQADYVGFKIEDFFVVGYGLDYDSYYRELPYIARLALSEEKETGSE